MRTISNETHGWARDIARAYLRDAQPTTDRIRNNHNKASKLLKRLAKAKHPKE